MSEICDGKGVFVRRPLLLIVEHTTAVWLGINSCSGERLLVLKGGSRGWLWLIRRTAVEIIWACSLLLFASADNNSTLRSFVLIVSFSGWHYLHSWHLVGSKQHTDIHLAKRCHRSLWWFSRLEVMLDVTLLLALVPWSFYTGEF